MNRIYRPEGMAGAEDDALSEDIGDHVQEIWHETEKAPHAYPPGEVRDVLDDILTFGLPKHAGLVKDMLRHYLGDEWPGIDRFQSAMLTIPVGNYHRSLFVTKAGRLGTGFPGTQAGDQVCILFGSNVPLVLRPEGEGFTLVGDAYLHGVMKVWKLDRYMQIWRC